MVNWKVVPKWLGSPSRYLGFVPQVKNTLNGLLNNLVFSKILIRMHVRESISICSGRENIPVFTCLFLPCGSKSSVAAKAIA